jgi:hypothetical protein
VGFLVVAIFWPLLFPAGLNGSSWGEDVVLIEFLAGISLCGVTGFLLCRKLTKNMLAIATASRSCSRRQNSGIRSEACSQREINTQQLSCALAHDARLAQA